MPAQISSLLSYLASPHASADDHRVRIVLELDKELVPVGPEVVLAFKDQDKAFDMLEKSGLPKQWLQSVHVEPRHLRPKQKSVLVNAKLSSLHDLSRNEHITAIRPARVHRTMLDKSVTSLGINVDCQSSLDGKGVTVAVIDTGIDANHPDLKGRVDLARSRNFTDEGDVDDISDLNGHGTHVAGIIGGDGKTYRGIAPGVQYHSL